MKPSQNNRPLADAMINACYDYPGQFIAISLTTHQVLAASPSLATLQKPLKNLPANSYITLRSGLPHHQKSEKNQ